MKLRLNWGYALMFVFICFGSGMSYLVYRCVKTNFDLVSKEYYKDEIKYQQVIDGTAQASTLSSKLQIVQEDENVMIKMPAEMEGKRISGSAWFYFAPDAKRDKKIALAINNNNEQVIEKGFIQPGKYSVRVSWDCNDQHYYSEQIVSIQ